MTQLKLCDETLAKFVGGRLVVRVAGKSEMMCKATITAVNVAPDLETLKIEAEVVISEPSEEKKFPLEYEILLDPENYYLSRECLFIFQSGSRETLLLLPPEIES